MIDEDLRETFLIFIAESHENLDKLDQNFIALEENPANQEMIDDIFRTVHTIKGMCGFMGFGKLEKITHTGESLLSMMRSGEVTPTPEMISLLLLMLDAVREILGHLEKTETEGPTIYSGLLDLLQAMQKPDQPKDWRASKPAAKAAEEKPAEQKPVEPAKAAEASDTQEASAAQAATASNASAAAPKASMESTLKVDVGLLDKLMNQMGELVLSRNQLVMMAAGSNSKSMQALAQKVNRITSELQEGLMKTRMQPIDTLFGKYPRLIRDLAKSCGKEVKLVLEGRDREVDKGLIEALKDPLTHLLRNSVDHGIETPAVRREAGKAPEGVLAVKAYHESGQVVVEISDDGAGIRLDKVKAKALEKGLITPAQATSMPEKEAVNLIFLPGFSTAEKVTNVSGRGVGMDVVASNIKKISGSIDIDTRAGLGTTIRVRIPLTLAIVPALVVGSAGWRYALPQVNLVELLLIEGEKLRKGLETVGGRLVYRLRGELLPLVRLGDALGTAGGEVAASPDAALKVVVLQAEAFRFGLIVDQVMDAQEIVVKPVPKSIMNLRRYSGATILGDGCVALILDVPGIARTLNATLAGDGTRESEAAASRPTDLPDTYLMFRSGKKDRLALPMPLVARVEEFEISRIETTGKWEVLQLQGEILPLVRLDKMMNGTASDDELSERLPVIVCRHRGRSLGLVVRRILDTAEGRAADESAPNRDWVRGNQVLSGQVTEIIDLEGLIRHCDADFFARAAETKGTAA